MSSALATQPEPAPVAKVSQPRLTNNALLMGASAVLLLGPLAFGSVEPWSIFALEACAMLLLAVWASRQWINRELNVSDHVLYRPMAAFFALVLVQWLVGTTAYRHVTYSHLLLYAAYGMLAFVVSQTLRRSSQFELLAKLFTGYGAVVASLAVLQGLAPNGKLYWIWPLEQGGSIYGPYVNHNHYAGLMEMLTPFPLVLAATQFTNGSRKIAAAGIAALMAGSIFLSGSRGGMAAFLAQMVVLGVLLVRKREGSWKQPIMLGAFLAMVIIFLVWMGSNELTQRLMSIHSEAREEINGGVRLSIDRDCLRMLIKRPFLGWGLGAFPIVYPEFRSFYTTFFVNQAHNDYLQLLVETGLAGFSIAVWFLVLVFRRAAGKLKNWTETASGALTVAALLGCVGILVHSFLDFNLQIPANAALFYVLCAIAASAPLQESQRRRVLRRHHLSVGPSPETTAS
ncbi:MAG TPA: O-antigen ligase family protein [Terriglobales bacterium]|nr:O-antigen ligase family protein [Terriglobales bacterium]